MTKTNAIAIEAIRKQIQAIAFDANLFYRKLTASGTWFEKCSIKRKQLLATIDELEGKNPQQLTFLGGV